MIRLARPRRARPRPSWCWPSCSSWRPAGVEEVEHDGDDVEYAVYGAPGELPALPDLRRLAGGGAWWRSPPARSPTTGASAGSSFHRPVPDPRPPSNHRRCPRFRPVARACARPGSRRAAAGAAVRGDRHRPRPGVRHRRARHHPAVPRAAARAACRRPAAGPLLDVGTGSGVLAIAAAQLGYAPVLALDNERESVAGGRCERGRQRRRDRGPPLRPAHRAAALDWRPAGDGRARR